MVRVIEEFPRVHATFNVVPSLGMQLEEYASGKFDETWFTAAFRPVASLTPEDKSEIMQRAFQLNYDNLLARWPRYIELAPVGQRAGQRARDADVRRARLARSASAFPARVDG